MPFSYKVVLTNSKKTVSSGIYKGRTHTKTTGVENLTTDTKPSGPGIVYVCSITGQRICSGHVRDVRNIREITSKVEISGTYVVYTTNDQGILMTSEVQHLMK